MLRKITEECRYHLTVSDLVSVAFCRQVMIGWWPL